MFKDNSASFAQIKLSEIPKVTYNDFLRVLKTACSAIGLNPSAFGTHSLRRGSVTDQFLEGIPDRVIKISGRWKSQAFERYIDQEMILRLHLHSIKLMEVNRSWPLTGKRSWGWYGIRLTVLKVLASFRQRSSTQHSNRSIVYSKSVSPITASR